MSATMGTGVIARSARECLALGRASVAPALRTAVDTLPGPMRRLAGYHFGWWDEHGQVSTNGASGKAFRPALVLLSAEAVGGLSAEALPAAVAVELAHNFSLIHDDVMDGDHTRRHRRTVWSVFGIGDAILVGSSLQTLAFEVLSRSKHHAAAAGQHILATAIQALLAGQSTDLAFERRLDIAVVECLQMVENKTGALLGSACALGASFGGGTPDQVLRLRQFGETLGLAFQHADDLLGIWGDPEVTGKPVFSDLRNHKKSLPVVAALRSPTTPGRELAEVYRRDSALTSEELVHVADLIDRAGGRAWSEAQAGQLLERATRHLSADLAPRSIAELSAVARLVADRNH
ncbi:family 2 encapsulin nanocompartment cargo protein polyprenyl transferase [Amycolatopsis azurea]|uniref:family 2 encapsulin nanocompartment cargo protein polyprenyl transferase n=1 Tax=Amycolatopsis azurea TaxID=36819 RepID=UPI00381BD7D7